MRSWMPALLLSILSSCRCASPALSGSNAELSASATEATARPGARPPAPAPIEALPQCPPGEGGYLERAEAFYDDGRFGEALSCAVQACGADPLDPGAHAERAWALVALGKLEEARTAYARALALDPDFTDALQGAAELYGTRLPFSHDYAELSLAYALRGRDLASTAGDPNLAASFASLAATSLNDLGRAREAWALAAEALAQGVDVDNARFEAASALWELCRFAEAKAEFQALTRVEERAAQAHHYLGLIAERDGDEAAAARELAEAARLDPAAFPPEVTITQEDFAGLVASKVAQLPRDIRRDLKGVPVSTQELPDLEDLVADDPPLSPTIVGLFRGPPLGEDCTAGEVPCRAIVLYRRNIVRTVGTRAELERQVEVTLLHEVGHLRGEDDTELVARGLE